MNFLFSNVCAQLLFLIRELQRLNLSKMRLGDKLSSFSQFESSNCTTLLKNLERFLEKKILRNNNIKSQSKNRAHEPTTGKMSLSSYSFNTYIIVENNLRVYINSQSLIKMALLRIFSELEG